MSVLESKNSSTPSLEATSEQKLPLRYTEIAKTSLEIGRYLTSLAVVDKLTHQDVYEKYTVTDLYKEQLSERFMSITGQSLEIALKLGRLSTDNERAQPAQADILTFPRAVAPESPGIEASLTRREQDMLERIATGLSNMEIATLEYVTEQTVKFHLSNVYQKLGARNRTEASRMYLDALESGRPLLFSGGREAQNRTKLGNVSDRIIELLKSRLEQPLTYLEIGEIVYADKSISKPKKAQRAGQLLRLPGTKDALLAEGIYLEKRRSYEVEGFEHLSDRTLVLIPQKIQDRIQ